MELVFPFTKDGVHVRRGTYPRANAAIASHRLFERSKLDGESKVPTMAVAMVLFQLGCLSFIDHFEIVLLCVFDDIQRYVSRRVARRRYLVILSEHDS